MVNPGNTYSHADLARHPTRPLIGNCLLVLALPATFKIPGIYG